MELQEVTKGAGNEHELLDSSTEPPHPPPTSTLLSLLLLIKHLLPWPNWTSCLGRAPHFVSEEETLSTVTDTAHITLLHTWDMS